MNRAARLARSVGQPDRTVDERARLAQLYERHSPSILAYARRRTARPEDALDVVAETFSVAWRRAADIPPGDLARPWLYGVARRVLANQRRSAARRTRLDDKLVLDAAISLGAASRDVDGPDAESIRSALHALSEQDRELLLLVGWDGLDHHDLALVLECSAGTVRVRLHRARRRFAAALDEWGVQRMSPSGHETARGAIALPDLKEA
jgi:RNA polymerase sigma-70 factor (ECF subfamily)